MSLNHRQQHQLYRIESGLRRSEPHLAAMLTVFDMLAAGQCLPAWEQVPSRRDRIARATARAFLVLAAIAIVLTRAVRALVTAPFSDHRSRPPRPKPERAGRDLETGESQDPEPRPLSPVSPSRSTEQTTRLDGVRVARMVPDSGMCQIGFAGGQPETGELTVEQRMEVTIMTDQFGGPQPDTDTDQFGGPQPDSDTDQFGGPQPATDTDQFGGPQPDSDTDQFGGPQPDSDVDQFGGPQPG